MNQSIVGHTTRYNSSNINDRVRGIDLMFVVVPIERWEALVADLQYVEDELGNYALIDVAFEVDTPKDGVEYKPGVTAHGRFSMPKLGGIVFVPDSPGILAVVNAKFRDPHGLPKLKRTVPR